MSQTQTDPLNKGYYTNKVLSISTTTTIDHPATANLAYTQYGDIKIEDGHDLIIKMMMILSMIFLVYQQQN